MFQVTTLPIEELKGKVDYKKDFFGKRTSLTVSGQLQAETFATAFSKAVSYTHLDVYKRQRQYSTNLFDKNVSYAFKNSYMESNIGQTGLSEEEIVHLKETSDNNAEGKQD